MNYVEDNRNQQILQYLEIRKSADIDRLAEKLQVSAKTVKNSIKEMNTMFHGSAIIECSENKYKLYILNQQEFKKRKVFIYANHDAMNSPINRIGFILKTLMNTQEPIIIDQLAYDMNIGRTTLIQDINKLRSMLEEYHINILGKTNTGLTLQGSEFDLRFFIIHHLYHVIYADYTLPLQVEQLIDDLAKTYQLDKMTHDNILKTFVICIDRNQHQRGLTTLAPKYYDLKNNISYAIMTQRLQQMQQLLHLHFPEEEAIYLSLPIIGMRTPMQKENFEFVEITEEIAELVLKILDIISQEMSFHISPTDLLDDFAYHIGFMLQRLKYGVKLKNISLMEAMEKYPLAFEMGEKAKQVIEQETNYRISDDELGFLSSYFGIFLEEQKQIVSESFHVGIISGSNRMTGKIIEVQLKRILDKTTTYEIMHSNELTNERLIAFDLLISVMDRTFDCNVPVVYASDIFDEYEMARKIEQIKLAKRLDFPITSGIPSYLAILLEPDRFFLLDEQKSDHDNMLYMVDQLLHMGCVDDRFKQILLQREQKGSMKFKENILFPHIVHEGDKIIFAIGVLKNSQQQQSQIIFLLGLPDDKDISDEVLMGVYDNIITVANDDELIHGISELKTGRDFLLYMIKNYEQFK